MHKALAAQYDAIDSGIDMVSVTVCSSLTGEPFVHGGYKSEVEALYNAGFNDSSYVECLLGAIDVYTVWNNTNVDYPFNVYNSIMPLSIDIRINITQTVMQQFRNAFGNRAVLANRALQPSPLPSSIYPAYQQFLTMGPPISFQTVSPSKLLNISQQLGVSVDIAWNDTINIGAQSFLSSELSRNDCCCQVLSTKQETLSYG